MSSYKAVASVSNALRSLLWNEFQRDNDIDVPTPQAIVFKPPTEAAKDSANRLSLWLYHITENEFVANQPMLRSRVSEVHAPPLALDLHFLVTPFAQSDHEDLLLLGKTMQIFHNNNILMLDDDSQGVAEELRINFNQGPLEELSRVWIALREPYRLSVCYQIRTVHIDSQRFLSSQPVSAQLS